ncbi:efflux RND transporter periplasmic adaptor subunit [Candidatus Roizmanbacteria bacterium]|nr:MAG: efflux RND transporter periplasmic adaptor subunit [Candidatus Roizmanbacteria bacterium]
MEKDETGKRSIGSRIPGILKNKWIIVIVIVGIIGGYFYNKSTSQASAQEATYTVTQGTLQDILNLSGFVDAEDKVDLHFQSGGRLSWVGVKEGDTVRKFDGIASLDTRQLEKTLQKYLNNYSKERRDFEQSNDDNEDEVLGLSQEIRTRAERTLENAQFDLDNSVLDVELQAIAKEYSFLYTPIDGIVTRVDTPNAGMNVSVTDTFQVINPDSIYFSISADQTEVVKLYEGMQGTITLDAYPDQEIVGTITDISFTPKTNESGTVYEAKMAFTPVSGSKYRLGMTGDVEFILEEVNNAVSIPFSIIEETDDGKTYVYKKVNGKKERVEITVGPEYDGQVQVLNGVYEGDVIYEIE